MRIVTGTLLNVAGEALAGAKITFLLVNANNQMCSSFSTNGDRITGKHTVTTDSNGKFEISLYENSKLIDTTYYYVSVDLQGDIPFRAQLSEGEPIDWWDFKTAGVKVDPVELNLLQEIITSILPNPNIVVIKTVGIGKDFETLHEALVWCEESNLSKSIVQLLLDDGVHVLGGERNFDPIAGSLYTLTNTYIQILGSSYDSSKVIITLDRDIVIPDYASIFILMASFTIGYVTVDFAYDGNTGASKASMLTQAIGKNNINLVMSTFKNMKMPLNNGPVSVQYCLIENCTYGLYSSVSKENTLINTEFKNCITALKVAYGAQILAKTCTFTNNTTNYNIPLNQIQYDGSYISTGIAALTFKP